MGFEGGVGLRCGLVVDDGTVGTVASDGVKADIAEEWLLGTQGRQLLVYAHLRLPALGDSRLEPAQELHQCDTVFDHGVAEASYLRGVLHGFHGRHG